MKLTYLCCFVLRISYCLSNNVQYKINSVYVNPKTKLLVNNHVAMWTPRGFLYYNELTDNKNRSNLMGLHMNISTVMIYNDSINDLEYMKVRTKDAISKQNYVLTMHIIEMFNVTGIIRFQPLWGTFDPTTKLYNGELGDIQTNISEFGGTPSFVTKERVPLFDFIASTTPTEARFLFRAPPLSSVSNVFYLPFDIWVWYCCVAILFVIYFVVYSIIQWEWRCFGFSKYHANATSTVLKPTFLDVVQMEIGAVCQQGAEAEPKSNSGRIATFVIFLSLMFLYTAFSACIVALLQSRTNSIKTLEDMLNSKMEMGAEDTSYNKFFLRLQTGKVQKAIVDERIMPLNKRENFYPAQIGVEKMRQDFFGFFAESDTMYKIIANTFLEQEKCGVMMVKYWSIPYPWVPMKKNSVYKELMKVGYAIMNERGIRSRSYHRIYAKKPACQNQGANFTSVSINDCYFALVAYAVGAFLSLCLLGVEQFGYKLNVSIAVQESYATFKARMQSD